MKDYEIILLICFAFAAGVVVGKQLQVEPPEAIEVRLIKD